MGCWRVSGLSTFPWLIDSPLLGVSRLCLFDGVLAILPRNGYKDAAAAVAAIYDDRAVRNGGDGIGSNVGSSFNALGKPIPPLLISCQTLLLTVPLIVGQ